MILYMDVRYEGTSGELDLTAVDAVNTAPAPEHGRLSTLLAWHEQDPPDAFEINRNNVVYSYQGNRNPFIDHPEFVEYIWDPTAHVDRNTQFDAGFYPNPVVSSLNVSVCQIYGEVSLQVVNALGETIISAHLDGKETSEVDCSRLPPGIYFLRLLDEQSRRSYVSTFTKK